MKMATKKIKTEDMILDALAEMQLISEASTRAYAQYQKAMLDGDLVTIRKANLMRKEHIKHRIKHFEKFIELVVNVRNLGNRRNGYQKRHFLSEIESYKDNLKQLAILNEEFK